MSIKQAIKKIPGVEKALRVKNASVFRKDACFWDKYGWNPSKMTKKAIEYKIVTELHKLEKGFGAKEMRPFGARKVTQIIFLADYYNEKYKNESSFALDLIIAAFSSYKNLYEEKGWTEYNQYKQVCSYLEKHSAKRDYDFGCLEWIYDSEKFLSCSEYEKFVKSRKSTRAYSNKKVTADEIEKAVKIAQYSPSACSRQPVKTYFVNSKKNKELLASIVPGLTLFEMDNVNLLLVTFDMSFVLTSNERNQGWFNAGLFAMNLVNALHSMGIGSCFLQYAETPKTEQDMKKAMKIPESERVAIAIACGHYKKTNKSLFSARKPVEEVFGVR